MVSPNNVSTIQYLSSVLNLHMPKVSSSAFEEFVSSLGLVAEYINP